MGKYIVLVILFCPLLLLAQYPQNNANWVKVLSEEFEKKISWNDDRIDSKGTLRAYFSECGITHGNELQVYIPANAFTENGSLKLKAIKESVDNVWEVGKWANKTKKNYNYSSGAIEFIKMFKYGYFEIRCKLPNPSAGNFPAFWLYSEINRYNEIDIFEQDFKIGEQRIYGTYHHVDSYGDRTPYSRYIEYLGSNDKSYSSSYHTFAVRWTPGSIVWYIDGVQKGVSDNSEYVPRDPMKLKANYALDDKLTSAQTKNFPMEMAIDYIRVYQLKCEHSKSVTLSTKTQLNNYSHSVKKNIKVGGAQMKVEKNLHLMATDYVEISGDFEVPLGVEFGAETVGCTCPTEADKKYLN